MKAFPVFAKHFLELHACRSPSFKRKISHSLFYCSSRRYSTYENFALNDVQPNLEATTNIIETTSEIANSAEQSNLLAPLDNDLRGLEIPKLPGMESYNKRLRLELELIQNELEFQQKYVQLANKVFKEGLSLEHMLFPLKIREFCQGVRDSSLPFYDDYPTQREVAQIQFILLLGTLLRQLKRRKIIINQCTRWL